MISLFLGYFLVITSSNLPGTVVILIKEATLNMLDRDDEFSVAGEYFSLFEYWNEFTGAYGDDVRLHLYNQQVVIDFLEITGISTLSE